MITYDNNDDDDDDDNDKKYNNNNNNNNTKMIIRVIFNEGTKLAMAVFSGDLSFHTI